MCGSADVFCVIRFSLTLNINAEAGLLDHILVLFLVFGGNSTQFFIMAVPVSIPADGV